MRRQNLKKKIEKGVKEEEKIIKKYKNKIEKGQISLMKRKIMAVYIIFTEIRRL